MLNLATTLLLMPKLAANKFEQSGATQVKGGFFGKNAAEVAGGFSSGNTVGAFVGSKK